MSGNHSARFSIIGAPDHASAVDAVDALNERLRTTDGEWVIVLDPGDMVAEHALDRLEAAIGASPDADLIYTDEDRLVDGSRVNPFHKPAWSPDRLRCQNYIGRLAAMRRSVVEALGGFRRETAGAHEWDLLLRVSERARRVLHLDEVLVHRTGATMFDGLPSSEAERVAAARTMQDHLDRTNFPAHVAWGENGCLRIEPALHDHPLVSIIIPTAGTRRRVHGTDLMLAENCVKSIAERSSYENIEIVCVVDAATRSAIEATIRAASGEHKVRFAVSSRPFTFSERINLGVASSRGDYVVLLNDDTEVIAPNWIEHLLVYATDTSVGAVGGTLLLEDGRIQHAGIVLVNGNPGHAFRGFPGNWSGYRHNLDVPVNYSAVTAACLMVRRETFVEVGGLAPDFPLNYNDVDFCLKLAQIGYRVVHTPEVRLFHYESASRGLLPIEPWELALLHERWYTPLHFDPFYSRHFLATADFVALEGMDGRTAADIAGASAAGGDAPTYAEIRR